MKTLLRVIACWILTSLAVEASSKITVRKNNWWTIQYDLFYQFSAPAAAPRSNISKKALLSKANVILYKSARAYPEVAKALSATVEDGRDIVGYTYDPVSNLVTSVTVLRDRPQPVALAGTIVVQIKDKEVNGRKKYGNLWSEACKELTAKGSLTPKQASMVLDYSDRKDNSPKVKDGDWVVSDVITDSNGKTRLANTRVIKTTPEIATNLKPANETAEVKIEEPVLAPIGKAPTVEPGLEYASAVPQTAEQINEHINQKRAEEERKSQIPVARALPVSKTEEVLSVENERLSIPELKDFAQVLKKAKTEALKKNQNTELILLVPDFYREKVATLLKDPPRVAQFLHDNQGKIGKENLEIFVELDQSAERAAAPAAKAPTSVPGEIPQVIEKTLPPSREATVATLPEAEAPKEPPIEKIPPPPLPEEKPIAIPQAEVVVKEKVGSAAAPPAEEPPTGALVGNPNTLKTGEEPNKELLNLANSGKNSSLDLSNSNGAASPENTNQDPVNPVRNPKPKAWWENDMLQIIVAGIIVISVIGFLVISFFKTRKKKIDKSVESRIIKKTSQPLPSLSPAKPAAKETKVQSPAPSTEIPKAHANGSNGHSSGNGSKKTTISPTPAKADNSVFEERLQKVQKSSGLFSFLRRKIKPSPQESPLGKPAYRSSSEVTPEMRQKILERQAAPRPVKKSVLRK